MTLLKSIDAILRGLDLRDLVDPFHILMGRERERGGFWNRVWREVRI